MVQAIGVPFVGLHAATLSPHDVHEADFAVDHVPTPQTTHDVFAASKYVPAEQSSTEVALFVGTSAPSQFS